MSTIKPPPTYQAKSRLMNDKGDVEQSRHVASAEKLRDPPINGIRPGHHSIPIAAANRSTSAGGSGFDPRARRSSRLAIEGIEIAYVS